MRYIIPAMASIVVAFITAWGTIRVASQNTIEANKAAKEIIQLREKAQHDVEELEQQTGTIVRYGDSVALESGLRDKPQEIRLRFEA